jgi:DNA-binding PadR family transcriptional regulator
VPIRAIVKAPAHELNPTAASLLGFLFAGPQSGYELAAVIEDSIGQFWNVTRSQIYRELRALDEAGYVRVGKAGVRERRPYAITASGRKAFDAWLARGPGEDTVRIPLLLTLFFGDRLPREQLARILRADRAKHEALLAEYRAWLPFAEREYPFPAKVGRFGVMHEEMILAWFDSLAKDGLL